jgi:signal-transduction protein with cAMP-binding, CBS, and nucleotidyltransferase domain
VTQGDLGTTAYIITDGAVDVIEDIMVDGTMEHNLLTRLYQGHVFGELSLIYDEPRVANVVSVGHTCCLCVTKDVFLAALSGKQFNEVMQQIAYKRAMTREQRYLNRENGNQNKYLKNANKNIVLRDIKSSNILHRQKSLDGYLMCNTYKLISEIGSGSYGIVYKALNVNNELVAIKVVNR